MTNETPLAQGPVECRVSGLTPAVDFGLWIVGQAVAAVVGMLLGMKYGYPEGMAAGYLLWVLVDIRYEVSKGR